MKKYLSIVLGLVMVFGFAASAFAIHAEIPSETQAAVAKGTTQVTLGGEVRIRGFYNRNEDFNDSTAAGDRSGYDMRVRLSVKADVTKNTTAFVHLESGDSDVADTVIWGEPTSGARGLYPVGNAKKGDMRILESWILHKGSGALGFPAGIKVGHMPLQLGWGTFFKHTYFGDDAIVFFMDPTKEAHIGLLTIKMREGVISGADDADAYVGLLSFKPSKDIELSADVTYVDDQTAAGGAGRNAIHLWNFGLRGAAKAGLLGLKAGVEIQSGKNVAQAGGTDWDYAGYAFTAGLDYKFAPLTLSLDFAYGSGDDTVDNKVKSFVTSLGPEQHFTYVYELWTVNAANRSRGGLTNSYFVKAGANVDMLKNVNLDLGLYLLRAVKKQNVNTVYGFANTTDSKDIGTEVDAKITYKIDKNLNYWVEGGYLWAGSFWKAVTGARDPDNAYAVRHGIQVSF
ncbi:MAG: alginate export family protein [Nitrospirae bacterium]|nr:alginate export family protein [Nitrospirota bacterium]